MAIGLVTTIACPSPSPIFLGPSNCQFCQMEGFCCSKSSGPVTGLIRPSFDSGRVSDLSTISFRCKNPLFGGVPSHWLPTGPNPSLLKVSVASDYSDSVPNSSNYLGTRGYHPLEEVKDNGRSREKMLTEAEIARTTVEANGSALLLFPGMVHCEPHRHISWAEFQYIIDDYGDIFFEIFDNENILEDRGANNPVNALIGMDLPIYGKNKRETDHYIDSVDYGSNDNISFEDNHDDELTGDIEVSSTLMDWGMPETLRHVHPMYFAKRLTKFLYDWRIACKYISHFPDRLDKALMKVVNSKYGKKMDYPSNGLSIVGCLRPAYIDEQSYLRNLLHGEDSDGYMSDWKGEAGESEKVEEQVASAYNLIDGEIMNFNPRRYGGNTNSTLYKLEIMKIELFSVYGDQSTINLQDFQDAEPDVLVHSAPAIIEHFSEYGMKCDVALKALCRKKKGLNVEGANLIGVDSLGMDVRAFSGVEARTLRFSFNARAITENSAEKKIRRMLFPRYYRKNLKGPNDGHNDLDSF